MIDFDGNRSAAAAPDAQFSTQLTLRRARRMKQMIGIMQRVAARLGLEDTALALDLAEVGTEADIERLLDGEARRRLSA